jgi:hypothetical protein
MTSIYIDMLRKIGWYSTDGSLSLTQKIAPIPTTALIGCIDNGAVTVNIPYSLIGCLRNGDKHDMIPKKREQCPGAQKKIYPKGTRQRLVLEDFPKAISCFLTILRHRTQICVIQGGMDFAMESFRRKSDSFALQHNYQSKDLDLNAISRKQRWIK